MTNSRRGEASNAHVSEDCSHVHLSGGADSNCSVVHEKSPFRGHRGGKTSACGRIQRDASSAAVPGGVLLPSAVARRGRTDGRTDGQRPGSGISTGGRGRRAIDRPSAAAGELQSWIPRTIGLCFWQSRVKIRSTPCQGPGRRGGRENRSQILVGGTVAGKWMRIL